jgi:hypothetical protein
VTRWGILLLIAFVALGLSPLERRRAMKFAASAAAFVIVLVFVRNHSL